MPGIICTFCEVDVGHGIENLTNHLHYQHNIVISKKRGFKCGQEGCLKEFQLYSSLKKHLLTSHRYLATPGVASDEDSEGSLDEDRGDNVGENIEGSVGEDSADGDDGGSAEEDVPMEQNTHARTIRSLSRMAAEVVVDMRSNSAVTGATLSRMFDCLSRCVDLVVSDLKTEVESVLREGNVDKEITSAVLTKFNIKNPFDKLQSIDQSVREVKNHFKYVEPVQVQFGEHTDYVRNKVGEYVPKPVRDTCQYIPILQVVELVLSNDIRDLVFNERDADENFMEKYRDGEHFKNHPLFSVNKCGLQLQIYYDDLEVVNPLGSRIIVHKLGAFYFRIMNLPHYMNSCLGAIHLFLLCYANDLKKYSFRRVLQPFLEDLKKLERGVTMCFKQEDMLISGTIAAVCADGLAAHEMFGLLGPQCKFFCRECPIERQHLLDGRIECENYHIFFFKRLSKYCAFTPYLLFK